MVEVHVIAKKYDLQKQDSTYLYTLIYIIVFFTLIFQGGYFLNNLLILHIGLILFILMNKSALRLDLNLLLMLLLLAVMSLTAIFQSINGYVAMTEWLKYSLFPLSYIVFLKIKNKERVLIIFYRSFVLLMIIGLLGVSGFFIFSGSVTIQGNRLQSFLQYANTTALFMGIGVLISIDQYVKGKKKQYFLLAILFGVALLFTQSRTTFVFFLFVLLLYVFRLFHSKAKLALIGTMISTITLLFFSKGRITQISIFEPTFIERIISFQDALRILFKETFGLGLGLGNWQFMQFAYQSAPYQVRYIHNVYLQIALDGGIIALFLFLGLVLFPVWKTYKEKSIYFYIYLFILIHSFFEVNFNFGFMILFFTYLLTRMNEPLYLNTIKGKGPRYLKYLLIIPLSICMLFFVSEIYVAKGDSYAKSNSNEASRIYQTARNLNPINQGLFFKLAKVERNVDQAITYLEINYRKNPYDYQVLKALSEGYLYKKDFERSYFYANQLFTIFPYNKPHQALVKNVLQQSYENKAISETKYLKQRNKLQNEITRLNDSMNPLYQYIDKDKEY